MTDAKGATAPGFQDINIRQDQLVETARQSLARGLVVIDSGTDTRPNVRRLYEAQTYVAAGLNALLMARAMAELRESGDG